MLCFQTYEHLRYKFLFSLLRKRILQFEQNKSTKHEDEIKEAIEIEHESKHHGDKAINKEWTDISHPVLAGNSEDHWYKEATDITEDKRGNENETDEKEYQ